MKTYIFIPPLAKMTGGVAVLFQVARHLVQGGFDACLVLREERSRAMVPEHLPTMVWGDLRLTPQDIWLVPEGWVNA
ncbi:MAG: glycosyltransferase family 1 protein, partial [Desulfovibrio sp.]